MWNKTLFTFIIQNNFRPLRAMVRKTNFSTTPPPASTDTSKFKLLAEWRDHLAKTMGVELGYETVPKSRENLMQYVPKSQSELPPRAMKDSFLEALIPLSTDLELQEKYITFLGRVRIGRLLEDMDIFSVMVVYQHILNPKIPKDVSFPFTIVTISVDRIDFTDFIPKPKKDIKVSGHVSWVGTSSTEVVVWLEQLVDGEWLRITRALFLLASRDAKLLGPAPINPIQPADERESQILSGGEERKKRRIELAQKHVSRVSPNQFEQEEIHNLYKRTKLGNEFNLKTRTLPAGCVWMKDCRWSNVMLSQPENRNLHNNVFGGFLMRQAEELSWVACYIFSKYRPKLKSISDISFQKPVAVSSLINMHAQVVFTSKQHVQIITYVETYNPVTTRSETTNSFHFTFEVPDIVPEVVPETYDEAMMYIDGMRHFNEVLRNTDGSKH